MFLPFRACFAAIAALSTLAGSAHAQLLHHVDYSANLPQLDDPTPVWESLLKVESTKYWQVSFKARGFIIPPSQVNPPGVGSSPNSTDKPVATAVFCAPWVERCATQVSDPSTVSLTVDLNGTRVNAQPIWVQSPTGMQRLRGALVTAPPGEALAYTARQAGSIVGIPQNPNPDGTMTARQMGPEGLILLAELELTFDAESRRVRLDENAAMQAQWPAHWPAEVEGALELQVFRDTGVDPKSCLVSDIDRKALRDITYNILKSRGISDPRAVPPLRLAKEIAADVCRRLRTSGAAMVKSADVDALASRVDVTIEGLADLQGVFEGLEVRDALTILSSNTPANDAERAVALAAVYRQAGLPCRVVVGFEAEEDDKQKGLIKKLTKPDAAAGKDKEKRPAAQPNRQVDYVALLKPCKARFWVEFALYHSDYGLAWIPLDPGKGGDSWRLGRIEGSERVVVLATNLWPDPIRVVGTPRPPPAPPGLPAVNYSVGWSVLYEFKDGRLVSRKMTRPQGGAKVGELTKRKKPMTLAPKNPERRIFDLAAGLWGYWIKEQECPTEFQQLSVRIAPKAVRASDTKKPVPK